MSLRNLVERDEANGDIQYSGRQVSYRNRDDKADFAIRRLDLGAGKTTPSVESVCESIATGQISEVTLSAALADASGAVSDRLTSSQTVTGKRNLSRLGHSLAEELGVTIEAEVPEPPRNPTPEPRQATNGDITPEMISQATKPELLKALRERGIPVDGKSKVDDVRALATSELVTV